MQTNYNLVMVLVAYLGSRKRRTKGKPEGGGQRRGPEGEANREPEVGGQIGVSRISQRGGRSGGQRGARRGNSKGVKLSHPLVYHATM